MHACAPLASGSAPCDPPRVSRNVPLALALVALVALSIVATTYFPVEETDAAALEQGALEQGALEPGALEPGANEWPRSPGPIREADEGTEPGGVSAAAGARAAAPEPTLAATNEAARARWALVHHALELARAERRGGVAMVVARPSESPPPTSGALRREYIQDAIREVSPLIAECYELALEEAPELSGRLVVDFTIGGEPDVGGIVEEADVQEQSELHHPLLDECIRETIYSVEFPPPEAGGQVHVTYPFRFAREEAEDAPPTE